MHLQALKQIRPVWFADLTVNNLIVCDQHVFTAWLKRVILSHFNSGSNTLSETTQVTSVPQLEKIHLTCKEAQPFTSGWRPQPRHSGAFIFIIAVAALKSLFPVVAPSVRSASTRPGSPALLGYCHQLQQLWDKQEVVKGNRVKRYSTSPCSWITLWLRAH